VSIEERAHAVRGQVDIVSDLHKGTTIRVRCPALSRGDVAAMLAETGTSGR
jgi:hypothetical protein